MEKAQYTRREFDSNLAKRRNIVKSIKRAASEHVAHGGTAQNAPKVIYFWGNNWAVLTLEHRRMLIAEIIIQQQEQQNGNNEESDTDSSGICQHCGHPY